MVETTFQSAEHVFLPVLELEDKRERPAAALTPLTGDNSGKRSLICPQPPSAPPQRGRTPDNLSSDILGKYSHSRSPSDVMDDTCLEEGVTGGAELRSVPGGGRVRAALIHIRVEETPSNSRLIAHQTRLLL